MRDWVEMLAKERDAGATVVLVTVVAAKGSVPRAPGTRMVVATNAIHGTIGGGHLEYKAITIARDLLAAGSALALHRFPLGASLGQCCGGMVELLFEPVAPSAGWVGALAQARAGGIACALVTPVRGADIDGRLVVTADSIVGTLGAPARDDEARALCLRALREGGTPGLARLGSGAVECFVDIVRPPEFNVVLFGAGHVGRAVVGALAALRCRILWVDSRDAPFPAAVPDGVECIATDAPEAEVAAAPAGAYFLVMMHSHAQDEALAERILARGDFAYFGLIGSVSKRRQFERRMETRGMARAAFAAMTCPIGIAGIDGKEPEVIAIAVAAQMLQVQSRRSAAATGTNARCA